MEKKEKRRSLGPMNFYPLEDDDSGIGVKTRESYISKSSSQKSESKPKVCTSYVVKIKLCHRFFLPTYKKLDRCPLFAFSSSIMIKNLNFFLGISVIKLLKIFCAVLCSNDVIL
jgi:hypothetical protein